MTLFEALQRARRYRRNYGTRQLVRESIARLSRRLLGQGYTVQRGPLLPEDGGWVGARDMVRAQWQACTPLRLFFIPSPDVPRVSIVTDSINRGHLYGGVGTAMIMGALLAQSIGGRLRVVTRIERAQPDNLASVLALYGIQLTHDVEFAFAPAFDDSYEIDQHDEELFITTSWWTTAATMASVRSDRIVYLLQEDERMFYPHGDEHMRCSRVLQNGEISFVINTRLLFDHLVGSGLGNIAARGIWFEPSFPAEVYRPRERAAGKRSLLFYARPNNLRNLFMFGIEVVDAAIARGILDLDQWELVFVGKDIPNVRFDEGRCIPRRLENLSWTQYAALAGTTDLALCLMYTPHPSYPPFDLAASGAVVVTNRFGNKQDLSGYSPNILCADLDLEPMLEVLARGIRLAADDQQRAANLRANALQQDWRASLAPVVQRFGGAG